MKRTRAKRLLSHYLSHWVGINYLANDEQSEINEIIDLIIEAAKEEILAELRRQEEDEQSGSYAEYKQRYGSGLRGD